jgi:hypothetical protein
MSTSGMLAMMAIAANQRHIPCLPGPCFLSEAIARRRDRDGQSQLPETAGVRQRIMEQAKLLYLPPCSLDLNPIERARGQNLTNCSAPPKHTCRGSAISPPLKPFRRSAHKAPKPGFDSRGFDYFDRPSAPSLILCGCDGNRQSRLAFSSRKSRLEQL